MSPIKVNVVRGIQQAGKLKAASQDPACLSRMSLPPSKTNSSNRNLMSDPCVDRSRVEVVSNGVLDMNWSPVGASLHNNLVFQGRTWTMVQASR